MFISNFFQILIKNSIERYQSSLIVVVHPWNTWETKKDGIRLSMSEEDSKCFIEILEKLLRRYKLGYLSLRKSSLKDRMNDIKRALKGEICNPNFNLEHFMKISAKSQKKPSNRNDIRRQERGRPNRQQSSLAGSKEDETYFSFYLEDNGKFGTSIRSVKIFQDCSKMSFSKLGLKRGRFFQNVPTDELFCLEFDMTLSPRDVRKILLGKIFVNGQEFSFLGCSSDGMKNRKAFLLKGDKKSVEKKLAACGEFEKIQSVSKRLARITLLFSSVYPTKIQIESDDIVYSKDILSKDEKYNFTDGCGGMSYAIRDKIYNEIPAQEKANIPENYLPAVYQFRLQGFKGVVAVDPTLQSNRQLLIRDSMVKFRTNSFPYIGICDFSRPYTYGHLNRQLIYLLSALGVTEECFLSVQRELFDLFSIMHEDADAAVLMLQWEGKWDIARLVTRLVENNQASKNFSVDHKDVKKALDEILLNHIKKDQKLKPDGTSKEKLRIFVQKSRMLYGVCDQFGKLEYGQCYLRITINGVPKTITGQVTSGRMPCYLLGDIRVLNAINVPELEHLVDCIVFPTKGKRPHADEQAGGDLDGDKFFVTWDDRLIPPKIVPSNEYPAAEAKREGWVTMDKMISYFSGQNLAMKTTGFLANLYENWADVKGPESIECQRIGQLFGRAIDATKTGEVLKIPESLTKVPASENKSFVWQKMEAESKNLKSKFLEDSVKEKRGSAKLFADDITEEFIAKMVEEQFTNVTEFQKFEFVWRYALNRFEDEEEAIEYMKTSVLQKLNFSLFSSTEKSLAIDIGVPVSLVRNTLMTADVLTVDEMQNFQMLKEVSDWGFLGRFEHSEFDVARLTNYLTHNDKTLISFQMPDDVVICLQFNKRLQVGEEQPLESGTFRAIFISRKFAYQRMLARDRNLYYDLVEDRFQIYWGEKMRSFLWLRGGDIALKKVDVEILIDHRNQNEMQNTMSVDLTSFGSNLVRQSGSNKPHPLVRKTPFTKVEVFAMREHAPVYPDVLVGAETELVDEAEIDQDPEDIIDSRDCCKILLDQLKNFSLAELSLDTALALFEDFVSQCAPWNSEPTEVTTLALSQLLAMLQIPWIHRLDIAACLYRLGHQSLAMQIASDNTDIYPSVSAKDLVLVLSKWTTILFVPPDVLLPFMRTVVATSLSDEGLTNNNKYIISIIWNSFLEFVNDITLCKENFEAVAIHNLRVDRKPKRKDDHLDDLSVTVYRSNSVQNLSSCPSNGDFVLLVREMDWKKSNRPQSVCAVATVDHVTVVPFTVKLKILDKKLPKVIEDDLQGAACKWMIMLLSNANITLYIRVIKACELLIRESNDNPVFQLIVQMQCPISVTMETTKCNTNETSHSTQFQMPVAIETAATIASVTASTTNISKASCKMQGKVEVLPSTIRATATVVTERSHGRNLPLDLEDQSKKVERTLHQQFDTSAAGKVEGKASQKLDFHAENCTATINKCQQLAINAALTNCVTLIHGPPGTGKTMVACEILQQAASLEFKGSILAAAETNTAADNITRRLSNTDLSILRVGSTKYVPGDLYHVSIDGKLRELAELEGKSLEYRIKNRRKFVKTILDEADIIITTCAGAGDSLLQDRRFTFVLVDEATQTKEATVMCALAHKVEKLVMIGDPKQLGPLVKIERDWNWLTDEEYESVERSLKDTLFHKLHNEGKVKVQFLDTQYRMHPNIMKFPSEIFYNGKLKSGVDAESRRPIWSLTSEPVVFISVEGKERRSGTSYENEQEAKMIESIVKLSIECASATVKSKDIAVLSLYNGQVRRLRKSLRNIEVSSIDGFQGREAEIILVSTVRSSGNLGR